MIKVNLNENVYVKLNENGLKFWENYHNTPPAGLPDNEISQEQRKKFPFSELVKIYKMLDGYYKFQLHVFMHIFGSTVGHANSNILFDTNILFGEKDAVNAGIEVRTPQQFFADKLEEFISVVDSKDFSKLYDMIYDEVTKTYNQETTNELKLEHEKERQKHNEEQVGSKN